jgi:hypothetical protein
MPQTDILNPAPGWDPELGDSMNPSYGFTRKRASTQLHKKAVGGTPWTRETANTGHAFSLSWLGRTLAVAERLKWYQEQYEDGFFTIVDWDGGAGEQGRHYVGRFTSEVVPTETANNRWDVQNVMFEEIPQQPMVKYPSDWRKNAIWVWPYNDFGDQKTATQGAWTAGYPEGAPPPGKVQSKAFTNPGTNAGDWAQHEYRGYGFKLYMLKGPAFGIVQVYVDGALVETVDLYSAAATGPAVVVFQGSLALDIHRVQVLTTNTKNAASSAPAATWWGLQVMR